MSSSRDKPLVSVIVPTLNGTAAGLARCLQSVKDQTYQPIELIVVVHPRTKDNSEAVAREFTDKVYIQGPERSAQVNFGVAKATGKYVYKIDDDFTLAPTVVAECVAQAEAGADAVVVHNTPDAGVSWIARIRKFEVDMYKYDLTHSSARFVSKAAYEAVGGFNSAITAGEDYDFQNKLVRAGYKTAFVDAEAIHHGEPKKLWPHLKKFYLYGKNFNHYVQANKAEATSQLGFGRKVYFKHWRRFVSHPLMAIEFLGYNLMKYAFGGAGLIVGRLQGVHKQSGPGDSIRL